MCSPSKKRIGTSTPTDAILNPLRGSSLSVKETHNGFVTIFKPWNGEFKRLRRSTVIRPTVPYYKREVLAYEIDQLFKFNIVPLTVITGKGAKIGSRQLWVSGDKYRGYEAREGALDQTQKLAFFDIVICNTDRHGGNYLYDMKDRKLWAIDNGLAFSLKDEDLICEFLDWEIQAGIREGNYERAKKLVTELPEETKRHLQSITKRRFMYRFRKYGMVPEGNLAWNRLQKLLSFIPSVSTECPPAGAEKSPAAA